MDTLEKYQTVFFDFDGLLVDTERLHYEAYKEALFFYGESLLWDFPSFLARAHRSADELRDSLTQAFPLLMKRVGWATIYKKKTSCYLASLQLGKIALMPGVSAFLSLVWKQDLAHCVVTNSSKEQVDIIKAAIPLLAQIPHWITREDYPKPKPAPDGYQKAMDILNAEAKTSIGFEDSLRGIHSLQAAGITPVLIYPMEGPDTKALEKNVLHFPSFYAFLQKFPIGMGKTQ